MKRGTATAVRNSTDPWNERRDKMSRRFVWKLKSNSRIPDPSLSGARVMVLDDFAFFTLLFVAPVCAIIVEIIFDPIGVRIE